MGKSVTRLYAQFQPEEYNVAFDIDEVAMRFSGTVKVTGKKVGRPSQRITLHSLGLTVSSAQIVKHDKKGNQTLNVIRINQQKSLNELRLHTEQMVYPGEYTVTVVFEAHISDSMNGIYPCRFTHEGADKQLIATQFESHYAREAFPCIDEPEAKAVFNLSVTTKIGVTVLANTPTRETTVDGEKQTTRFDPTPKMSSYLLAFALGEIHNKATKTKRGTDVRIWSHIGHPLASLDFALDVAKRCIEYFEDYFGVDYPLAKSDHIALPDFSVGAMENWGLITYRERVLLAYPGETPQSTLEQIALVIAHETSHQWFGNLVTMRWWNDLWLNESFANMMEYQAVDNMFPEWKVWNSFIAGDGLSAFRRDAIAGVQAVKIDVHHPDEISTLFDPSIVYAKGGRLLYMLKNFIGEDTFRQGLKKYFELHSYGNTEGADLWNALSEASGQDVAAFMNPWLTRSGFPLVTINQDEQHINLSQQQFSDNPAKADPERFWPIPLFTDTTGLPNSFDKATVELTDHFDATMLNLGARGHYLVRYATETQRQRVMELVREQKLSEPDRLMLLNGASMLARAGYEPYADVLTMLSAYKHESSEPVWDIMALVLGESRRFIDAGPELESKIKKFTGKMVADQVARLGWEPIEGESSADQKLRALALGLSAYAEDDATVTKATELFSAYQKETAAVTAELRGLTFVVPIKNGDDAAFDYLLHLHDTTQNSDLMSDACDALTATRKPEKASLLLSRLKDNKVVKPQDVDRWLVYLLRNRYVRSIAWDWMVANWQWLEDTFKGDMTYDYLPRYAASCVNSREYQLKFADLFENKQDQLALKRNIALGFEEIENRVSWLERDLTGVQKFFN